MGRAGIEPATLGLKVLQLIGLSKCKNAVSTVLGTAFVGSSNGIVDRYSMLEGRFFALRFQMRIIGPVFRAFGAGVFAVCLQDGARIRR
jgi:hypothetical protein